MRAVKLWFPLMFTTLALTACGEKEGEGDDAPDGGPIDTDEPTGDTADTGDFTDPLVVAALGFELLAGWDQENQLIEPYLFPDLDGTNGGPLIYPAWVVVTLASIEYFDPGGYADEDLYCSFLGFFTYLPSDQQGEEFDWDAGNGGTGVELETWGMFEGTLTVVPETYSSRCEELDTYLFPSGDPMSVMDGMHFGVGFGPLSTYLDETMAEGREGTTDEANEWDVVRPAYMTQFIAINHPDGDGGYTFPAYDWNVAFLVETDYTQCDQVTYTTGYTYDACGLIQTTGDPPQYLLGDTTIQPIHGYTQGGALWLEDTPNLDLTILKEGAI